MAASVKLLPGATIRWQARRYVIVDYAGLDAIVGREIGKRKFERIPVGEAQLDQTSRDRAVRTPDLVSMPESSWQSAVQKFKALRGLLEMDEAKRGNGIVKTGRHAQSHHPKRRGINAHAATVRRQVCHHGPTLLPDGTDPNVWQKANADLHRSLLDLGGACSRAERVLLALGELR
jgi:hypothetical protein